MVWISLAQQTRWSVSSNLVKDNDNIAPEK